MEDACSFSSEEHRVKYWQALNTFQRKFLLTPAAAVAAVGLLLLLLLMVEVGDLLSVSTGFSISGLNNFPIQGALNRLAMDLDKYSLKGKEGNLQQTFSNVIKKICRI